MDDWDKYNGDTTQSYSKTGLTLMSGALYSVRVGVTNNAGVMAIHETNGVKLDLTKPKVAKTISWLKSLHRFKNAIDREGHGNLGVRFHIYLTRGSSAVFL